MIGIAKQSLRRKLALITLGAVALALIATLTAVALFEFTTFRPRAVASAQTQAALLADIIVPALEFDDARTAQKMLGILQHESAVTHVVVYRANGDVLGRFQRSLKPVVAPAAPTESSVRIVGRQIFISKAVATSEGLLGRIWLQAEMPGWADRVSEHGLLLLIVALAVVVLSLVISITTRKHITDPLQALAETVHQIGERRDLTLRVAERGSDEIGVLARSFNSVLVALERHDIKQREREGRLARQNKGLVEIAAAQKNAPEDIAGQARRLTEILCAALEVERASIWRFSEDGTVLESQALYIRSSGVHSCGDRLQTAHYPKYFSALAQELALEVRCVKSDPRTTELLESYLVPLGIGAMLDAPVYWRGRLAGVVCIEHVGGLREWALDEVGFACSATDRVTLFFEAEEARRAAMTLRETEERYRNLIEEARDAIFTLAPDGEILALNQAVEAITGWLREAWLGRNFTERLQPADIEPVQKVFREVLAGGHVPSMELRMKSKAGADVILEFAFSPRFKGRAVVGLLGVGRDVTERTQGVETKMKLEAQLRQSQKMEAIGNLAGGIAHDFNNILTGIMGNVQLATQDFGKNHPAYEYLSSALLASNRARDLVRQIMTFSRQQEQRRTPLQLSDNVAESIKLLRSLIPSTVTIRLDLPSGLPTVLADATQVHQVIMNLATNAVQAIAGEPGQLGIKLQAVAVDAQMVVQKPQLKPGRYVCLAVSDTGPGITGPVMERLFEPFFTTKEPGKGTGLGLAVVHGIMEQHQGCVLVYSVVGEGTTFQLYFPVCDQEMQTPIKPLPAPPSGGQGQRIMMVDDELIVTQVAERILRRNGYQVASYLDPVLALEAFRLQPEAFDLVITDLTMPGMKGTALVKALLVLKPGLPIVMATGFAGELDPAEIKAMGLHGYLQKPFSAESLLSSVSSVVARTGTDSLE